MENIVRLTIAVIVILTASVANGQQRFNGLCDSSHNIQYQYVSPAMLKAMSQGTINVGNVEIPAKSLTFMETFSAPGVSDTDDIWKTIRKVIKDEGLETLTTNLNGMMRRDLLGKFNGKGQLTRVMLISQHGGNWISVSYVEGCVPLEIFINN